MKQYNLTVGRSLPEWLDERKRRSLLKKDEHLRRRIELLQDFTMPTVSNRVTISDNGEYILTTGTYKPRIRCYDVNQLGLKFERCFDSEAVAFKILSEDYSKLVFLQCDRHVELHSQCGRYYRIRVPKFGRDMAYNLNSCDLYVVGDGQDVHRLNLEQGRFLSPLTTPLSPAGGMNVCQVNPEHQLLLCGTTDGTLSAFDPRTKAQVSGLDVGKAALLDNPDQLGVPQVTSLSFRDGLNVAVGTSSGQILLYDLRSSRPLLTKDHQYGIPIKTLAFHKTLDQVISLDGKAVKIWDRQTGKPYTTIESEAELNEFTVYPESGLMFMANEQPKLQVHYVPSLGPAPRWCSFLDNIAEEIEESAVAAIYDDYKFITKEQVQDLGMDHLVGSSLLRAYMHGYFIDARLFRKAQSLAQPYTLQKFIKDKVDSKLEEQRAKRVHIKSSLPTTNKELYLKLKDQEGSGKGVKKQGAASLLADDRFKDMFTDDRFQVDKDEDVYKLINPVLSKLDSDKVRRLEKQFEQVQENEDTNSGDDDHADSDIASEESSSDDDNSEWTNQVKEQHRLLKRDKAVAQRREKQDKQVAKLAALGKPRLYELKDGENVGEKAKKSKKSLAERLERELNEGKVQRSDGHQMVFRAKKSKKQVAEELAAKKHREERQQVRRSASSLKKDKIAPKFWMGKRVN